MIFEIACNTDADIRDFKVGNIFISHIYFSSSPRLPDNLRGKQKKKNIDFPLSDTYEKNKTFKITCEKICFF